MSGDVKRLYDSNGVEIVAGCHIHFSYGIPPVEVSAKVVKRGRDLVALTPGHTPASANVNEITQFFDCWVRK